MQGKPHIPERPPGRLPTTSVTNEIARAVNGLYDLPPFGQVNEPVAVPLARPQMIGITNKSGENVPQFGVLGLDAPTFSPEDTDPLGFQIDGVLPTTEDHAGGHFAIVVQGLAATGSSEGEFGYAVVSGVVKAWVNVTDEDHQFADVKDGDVTQLESGDTGSARIIAKDSGTGKKLCVVLLGSSPPPVILAKITGNVALRTSDSISIGGGAATTCAIQWKYAWEEVRLLSDGSMETVDGGRSGTTSEGFALCEAEYANTEDGKNVGGIDITGDSYPEGFRPVPIPAGTPVRLTKRTDSSGENPVTFYTFEGWQTKHDGNCEEA